MDASIAIETPILTEDCGTSFRMVHDNTFLAFATWHKFHLPR